MILGFIITFPIQRSNPNLSTILYVILMLITPFVLAGIYKSAETIKKDHQEPTFQNNLSVFSRNNLTLLKWGGLSILILILSSLILFISIGAPILYITGGKEIDQNFDQSLSDKSALGFISFAIFLMQIFYGLGAWLGIVKTSLDNTSVIEAFKLSFKITIQNPLESSLLFVSIGMLSLISFGTLLFGFIITIPLSTLAIYEFYQQKVVLPVKGEIHDTGY